jgi:hypothetical protein
MCARYVHECYVLYSKGIFTLSYQMTDKHSVMLRSSSLARGLGNRNGVFPCLDFIRESDVPPANVVGVTAFPRVPLANHHSVQDTTDHYLIFY